MEHNSQIQIHNKTSTSRIMCLDGVEAHLETNNLVETLRLNKGRALDSKIGCIEDVEFWRARGALIRSAMLPLRADALKFLILLI